MKRAPYDSSFFDLHGDIVLSSARIVVPIVMELVRPTSVIDVGCGRGTWLKAFAENGVEDLKGIDGDYVDCDKLMVPRDCFSAADLSKGLSIDRRYDLVVCLEVIEHIPDKHSGAVIEAMTRAAPVVMFSAAVPGQGGTDHVNEQWPEYWRAAFEKRGFTAIDAIRPRIRDDSAVGWFYRQNITLFAEQAALEANPRLCACLKAAPIDLEWIHTELFRQYVGTRNLVTRVPPAVWQTLKRRAVKRTKGIGQRLKRGSRGKE
jgi:SAM-dependent methyltransferase